MPYASGGGGCGLSGPTGMDVLQDGRLVVADTGNDRVLIYEADWSSVTLAGGGNLQALRCCSGTMRYGNHLGCQLFRAERDSIVPGG